MEKQPSTSLSAILSLASESKTSHKTTMMKKEEARKARGDCEISESTSHTQFFRKSKYENTYERVTTDEYFGMSESMSNSSALAPCDRRPGGKIYTETGLLKRNLKKGLDRIPTESKWNQHCKPTFSWEMAENLAFLVLDPTIGEQKERLIVHLQDFNKISKNGYRIDILDSVCIIMDYLIEKLPNQKQIIMSLLENVGKPILMTAASDIVKFSDTIANYMGFMGYLLMRVEEEDMFDVVSRALTWHLSAPDAVRVQGSVSLRHTQAVAAPVLTQLVCRMLSLATAHRFPTYLEIALILACNSVDNCLELIKDNIIENILYRFNPYFPDRKLPVYDINPADPQDIHVKLGDSSCHMETTLSLLFVLLQALKDYLAENPKYSLLLPCPDVYAQRCFVWAYRYECRAREHQHQRNNLSVVAMALLHCFGNRLQAFSSVLMPDILTLSVLTEVPARNDHWASAVNFNTGQQDVQFKKRLICFSVQLLKVFPTNSFMVESRCWLLGLMYLLDPGLCYLRARWSPALFAEIRKTALQALVCALPLTEPNLVKQYGLIRRIMWYIEWYSESPYELPVLYWCLRLLQVTIYKRGHSARQTSMQDLFDTHGVIIVVHLCYTLLKHKTPPVEKAQAIMALSLRILTSAVESQDKVACCVYPHIQWPQVADALTKTMLDVVLTSLEKHYIINDRWLISLLNFIWEAIIWKTSERNKFISNDGIYKLLDLVTVRSLSNKMTRAPVQCVALALVCDTTRAGGAVGQLVTWRASRAASNAEHNLVKRGATIATLLAAVFRDECLITGVSLDHNGVLQDLDSPILSSEARKEMNNPSFCEGTSHPTPACLAAADIAGSRMSKAYAILNMLSEDLEYKVTLADEAYKMYKNIKMDLEDETVLVLCAHYLTLMLNEVWIETKVQSPGLLQHDEDILEEFLHIGKGWSKVIQRQQNEVVELHKKKESEEENSFYEFLGRVRLNIALDALREVRCAALTADRLTVTLELLYEAVRAHHRRSTFARVLRSPVLKTCGIRLDAQNLTRQNVKVCSIFSKDKPMPLLEVPCNSVSSSE